MTENELRAAAGDPKHRAQMPDTVGSVSIIMYHYIREPAFSRYPELKARTADEFQIQLDYLEQNHTIISADTLVQALNGGQSLPVNSCLLTFDDGYIEHYLTVFPELVKRGLSAAFYPSVQGAQRNALMEVNKIQFIFAKNGYSRLDRLLRLFRECYEGILEKSGSEQLLPYDVFFERHYQKNTGRFDPPEVVFLKTAMQHALPHPARTQIIDRLYENIMDVDEKTLARETYMSVDMLKVMAKNRMHIGSHGGTHVWMDKLSAEEQARELTASRAMLSEIYGTENFAWSMCYPFGRYDASLKALCADMGCAFAVTIVPQIALVGRENYLELPRFDTNDFPH